MTPEQRFIHWLRPIFPNDADYCRIENVVGVGVPDINVCYRGREVWIEAKYVYDELPQIRKAQYAWGMRRASVGGNVYVLGELQDGMVCAWKYPFIGKPYRTQDKYVIPPQMYDKLLEKDEVFNYLFPG